MVRLGASVGIAVIGCGGIAQSHLGAMGSVEGCRLVATVDLDVARARESAEKYGAQWYHTDLEAALSAAEVDAVIVCLPHHLHTEPVLAAARAGKHILVEKPMALTLADCDAMIAAARASGVTLAVGQVLRARNANRRAREIIQSGIIGQPLHMVRRRYGYQKEYPSAPWSADPRKAGGWVLYGYGAHEFDMAMWLVDDQAETVYAAGRRLNPHWQDYDEISAILTLRKGAVATIAQSVNAHNGAWDQQIMGTEGSLYLAGNRLIVNGQTEEIAPDANGGIDVQLQAFVDAIRFGTEPLASGQHVRHTMAALEAAKESLATGTVVQVANA